ncbi:hypothetical protein [Microcella flavibacter]|uniref:hypothetical protein n=1 Tax=Microcella flavibacter TaxID=1804990 RepID=UPI001456FCAC|nr:hypothetical protein [Microcella flavibacter]
MTAPGDVPDAAAPGSRDAGTDTDATEQAPAVVASFTMLGSPDAAACEGDVCAVPLRD